MESVENVSSEGLGRVLMADEEGDFVAAVGVIEMHIALTVQQANARADEMISRGNNALGNRRIADDALSEGLHILALGPPFSRRFGNDFFLMIIGGVDAYGCAFDAPFGIPDGGYDDNKERHGSGNSISP